MSFLVITYPLCIDITEEEEENMDNGGGLRKGMLIDREREVGPDQRRDITNNYNYAPK